MPSKKVSNRKVSYPTFVRENIDLGKNFSRIRRINDKLERESALLDLAEIPALRLLCDNLWKEIGKALPDLKAVEHTGEVTSHVVVKFNP